MLADDLLEDARHLAARADIEMRTACMRRAISAACYSVFHLLVGDSFPIGCERPDERPRFGRMFDHRKMREAGFTPKDKNNPTLAESSIIIIKQKFVQLQSDRHRAAYELDWNVAGIDAARAITLAQDVFVKWRSIRSEAVARHYLLSMFGANR